MAWRWRLGRGRPTPPPEDRGWLHPSELPSFTRLPTHHVPPVAERTLRIAASLLVLGLVGAAAGFASSRDHSPPNQPMSQNVAMRLAELPPVLQRVAPHVVDLTITTPSHVTTVAAMVLPGSLAVTTAAIPHGALLTAWVTGRAPFMASWVGRDRVMGFSIVRLSQPVAPAALAPMPASASVTALAPVTTGPTVAPRFTWSTTTIGDPVLRANGVVSYLAAVPESNLDGLDDAVAVNADGRVVAVLAGGSAWYPAQFVARVAQIVATGDGCHAGLGIAGTTAQGGGVLVTHVPTSSPAHGRLRAGDVLVRLDGHSISTWTGLLTQLYLTPARTLATIDLVRGSRQTRTEVWLTCAL